MATHNFKLPWQPFTPYIRPSPETPVERVAPVTIAAGFRYNQGILLATDTQHTYSRMLKLSRPKLIRLDFTKAKVGIAIAGNVDFALMATEKIQKKLSQGKVTHRAIQDAVENVLIEIFKKHIYPSGSMFYENAFDLLIAQWTEAEGIKLLQTSNSSVTEIKEYGIIGVGLYLAQFLSKAYIANAMTAHTAFMFAVDILQKVKENVDGCGGQTDVLLLDGDGWTKVPGTDIKHIEDFSRDFGEIAVEFGRQAADLSLDESELDDFVELMKLEIHEMRRQQKERIEKMNKIVTAQQLKKRS